MQTPPTITPQWIAKMYPAKTGLDHLGLGSVSSDQILPSLSPGVNVLTIHPRYYSFYTFLLDEFWRRNRPRSRAAGVSFAFLLQSIILCVAKITNRGGFCDTKYNDSRL